MKRKKLLIVSQLFLHSLAFSQEVETGSTVPDVVINNLINFHKPSVKISDFRGKILILDFWATWCNPCVSAFPKLDSLQKKYPKDIQILAITTEKEEKVRPFLKRMEKIRGIAPPSAAGDEELSKTFKHTFLPHYVWIDKNGKLIATTESDQVTDKNIRALLNGESIQFRIKNDSPFQVQNNEEQYYNNISGYKNGRLGSTTNEPNSISVINAPILTLYKVALWKHGIEMLTSTKMIVDIKDTAIYSAITPLYPDGTNRIKPGMDYENWLKSGNGYCYELFTQDQHPNLKFEQMLQELNSFFGKKLGIEGAIEKRNSKCLALIRTDTVDRIKTTGAEEMYTEDAFSLKMVNHSIPYLLIKLAYAYQSAPPLVDLTNYKGKIDLDLTCTISNLTEMNAALEKYGLKFVEQNMPIEIAVIRKKSN